MKERTLEGLKLYYFKKEQNIEAEKGSSRDKKGSKANLFKQGKDLSQSHERMLKYGGETVHFFCCCFLFLTSVAKLSFM